ncbi:MAG: stage II sporulation protein P [Oscillospiraceae bacterium]
MFNFTKQKKKILVWGISLAVCLPTTIGFFSDYKTNIANFLLELSIASSIVAMPEGGLALIKDRFDSEIFTQSEKEQYEEIHSSSSSLPPSSSSTSSHLSQIMPNSSSIVPPSIAKEYEGTITEQNMAGKNGNYTPIGSGYLKNFTKLSTQQIHKELKVPLDLTIKKTKEPQVLIIHTHATESYTDYDSIFFDKRNTFRTRDHTKNMVAVGKAFSQGLEKNGIGVIHDTTEYDYPSYGGAYDRSAKSIKSYLKQYPTIKVVLDIHRDALEIEENNLLKPVTVIDGKKAAQLMIISCGEDGTYKMPYWKNNLRFGAAFENKIAEKYDTLTRPLLFCYRKYNQDLNPATLLLEFGSNSNTLEESIYTAQLTSEILADLLKDHEIK